jgi:transposase-like protein/IS1 family transposase
MLCSLCQSDCRRFGKNRNGSQRFRCGACAKTFTDEATRPHDNRCLPTDKLTLCLRLLLEGNSVRSVERITGVHRDTIIAAMIAAGEKCKRFLEKKIKKLNVDDVQCDEIWSFIHCKEKTRLRKRYAEDRGDCYTFTAIDRHTKLLIAWHVGKRSQEDCLEFSRKLACATTGRLQVTTDGFKSYTAAIPFFLKDRVDFAQLIKVYGRAQDDDHNYTPPKVVDCYSKIITGQPDKWSICTSHVERANKTMRMQIRRFTRLTDGHSKKWENHEAALALFFGYYNWCRVHSTIRTTPAVAAGLASEPWNVERLLAEANKAA